MIYANEFYKFNISDPITRNDLLVLVGLANEEDISKLGCNECEHRTNECDQEYSTADWPDCSKDECRHIANLKGFPFKRVPKFCRSKHFQFAHTVMTGVYWALMGINSDIENYRLPTAIRLLIRSESNFGKFNLSDKNKKRVAAALEEWRKAMPQEGGE